MRHEVGIAFAMAFAASLALAGCEEAEKQSLTGKYVLEQSPDDVSLELLDNHTYKLCVGGKPCGTGTYDVTSLRKFKDGSYKLCDTHDRCGTTIAPKDVDGIKKEGDRIDFVDGPLPNYVDGPDWNKSEGAFIEYDWSGDPMFTFTDPDSGVYFKKDSD